MRNCVARPGRHVLPRAIRTATTGAIEIPTRDDGGAIRVHGTAEECLRAERAIGNATTYGSLTAVCRDLAQSHISPLESLAAEQP